VPFIGHTASGVGDGVGEGVGDGVGEGDGDGVGDGEGVGDGVGEGDGVGSGLAFITMAVPASATTTTMSPPSAIRAARDRGMCIGAPC
jgi:hypothetical protein